MLPLYLLTNAKGQKITIELKNGETIKGVLTNVDNWMNLTLSDVIQYDSDALNNGAEKPEGLSVPEIYLRGTYIKYINLQDDIIENVRQQINSSSNNNNSGSGNTGSGGGYGGSGQGKRQNRYNSGNSGNYSHSYRRGGNKRNYNQGSGNRRSYYDKVNNNNSNNNNGMGGYVQHHQSGPQQPQFNENTASVQF
ncbi:hypothetical protein Kpol_1045p29 [Vanderwaltozyma polyspora DSM 70294]|uniref:LSM complex subunit LSM4 n=1 Tax=Vanderwaltozyma polyspora (strain ATCC 22028 / DSM 70294 / BCRC 21397 / CBS 2163 / NBRC 10782 / NRRL Y-8283 / UCD 57-17) TaxID=436907 RepID=A7TI36_VANPO|nr:uncharacterized protein Kpol_1045p29 [Vanderwaltozyma polyspora DSM 70294]EDO18043.1 hypothetical protein Kpol_1045p29 [Vanderwaltozyma polyspora DSM 70294]